jgi:hypothetical protein
MKRIIVCLSLAAASLWAQAAVPNVKLIPLKHVATSTAMDLLTPFRQPGSPVRIDEARGSRLLAISGSPDAIAVVEEYIKKFDVPPPPPPPFVPQKNVEVTAYMLLGVSEAESADLAPPADLAGVVKQLRGMFPFKSYWLVETMIVRGRENNGGEASGVMAMPAADKSLYQFKYARAVIVPDEKGRIVRLDGVRIGARIPYTSGAGVQYLDTGVNTDVDLREGQKVVVGKTSVPGQTSLFLVLTARVVE